ncbi:MAG: DnaB-like helicase C-terminal domain-containing protein [Deltaproteobacteria bacterium]
MSALPTDASPPRNTDLETALDDELVIQQRSHPLNLGFPKWERLTRPSSGLFMVLGGRPGQFKTTWAWTMAANLALAGKRVCWIGLEMRPGQMAAMLVSRLAHIPRKRLEDAWRPGGALTSAETRAIDEARMQMSLLRITFHDPARNSTIDVIESARKVRYDAVFVDHLGLVGAGRGDEFEKLNDTITALRRLAHGELAPGYYPAVVALSQLNRDIEKTDTKKPAARYPRMSDLRGSGRLEADADAITILHRPGSLDPENQSLDLRAVIVKNRQGPFPVALQLDPKPDYCLVEETSDAVDPPVRHYSDPEPA